MPVPNAEKIVGREAEIATLDRCWNERVRIVSIVAFGGVGKSSLVHEWLQRMDAANWRGAARVYAWSFYQQGTGGGASSDAFFDDALKWFGEANPPTAAWEKGRRLAELVQKERTLLMLDGIEPLQAKPEDSAAKMPDTALAWLLRSLASANSGLCVLTTRIKVTDLYAKRPESVHTMELNRLSEDAGAELLRMLGADGTKKELAAAVSAYNGHAFALTLLGTYVRDALDGQIVRRYGLPNFEGEPAQRMMALYEQWFVGKPELSILHLLGLFDRPAPKDEMDELRNEPAIAELTEDLVRTRMFEPAWNMAVARLRNVGLVAPKNADGALDVHPLVREYFGKRLREGQPDAFREGHRRLYEFLQKKAKPLPETLEEMEPLYNAVAHGCLAGKHQEALNEIWGKRICRGDAMFGLRKLGSVQTEVTMWSRVFEREWEQLPSCLTAQEQERACHEAGFALSCVGRLHEAAPLIRRALDARVGRGDWNNASRAAHAYCELQLEKGELDSALQWAETSILFAYTRNETDREKWFLCSTTRAMAASVHHARGDLDGAAKGFNHAERIQQEYHPEYPKLYSVSGFRYWDFLLDCHEVQDACERAETARNSFVGQAPKLDMALCDLTLARGWLLNVNAVRSSSTEESKLRLDQAVNEFVRTGNHSYLPLGLLARAALHIHTHAFADARVDLDEAMDIATHCGFRLHECDAHLGYARLAIAERDAKTAREHLEKARAMIDEMGYHRRDRDVQELDTALAAFT